MPSSNILLFDANKANMMSDEQYNTNTQRLNGVQSGIASSQLQNKTLYQVSLVAYAIAQIMNQNGLDANDTAAVSAFVANLSGTMLQKVADLATTQEAQAGVATGKWMSPALVRAAMNTYTSNKWLPLTGGTMKGNLILNTSSPTNALQAASKGYVDNLGVNLNMFKRNLVLNQTVQVSTSIKSATLTIPNLIQNQIGVYIEVDISSFTILEVGPTQSSFDIWMNFFGDSNFPLLSCSVHRNKDNVTVPASNSRIVFFFTGMNTFDTQDTKFVQGATFITPVRDDRVTIQQLIPGENFTIGTGTIGQYPPTTDTANVTVRLYYF